MILICIYDNYNYFVKLVANKLNTWVKARVWEISSDNSRDNDDLEVWQVLVKGVGKYMVTNGVAWRLVSHKVLEKWSKLKTGRLSSKKKD